MNAKAVAIANATARFCVFLVFIFACISNYFQVIVEQILTEKGEVKMQLPGNLTIAGFVVKFMFVFLIPLLQFRST
jgi:hypothetical protein